ncbi:MAG: site-specific integrase [Bacteroidales bacterium]|nr:site-specific integrase [Bacteroidales bacterium]
MNNLNTHLQSSSIRRRKKTNKIFVEELITERQLNVSPNTQKVNLALLKHLKEYHGKGLLINDIDSKFCLSFASYLINNAKVKITSAKTYMHKLHAILQEAVYLEYICSNPMPPMCKLLPKYIPAERESLTVDEVKKLENTECKHEETKLAFLFSCYTGIRLSDIETLRWENIRRQKDYYALVKIQVKTNQEVRVPLSSQALIILEKIKKMFGKANETDLIFPMYSRTTIYSDLKEWAKKAKIDKHITFHVSRISFVTISISAGISLYVISKLCGHKNIKTTQIYARILDSTYIDAINNFENMFEKPFKKRKKHPKSVLLL